jgi:hypothetical protein
LRAEAHQTGERALEHLRYGVTEALRQLGNGFLQHPENERLRAALSEGEFTAEGYFQELLRLVYRLLFLFTAEERNLLHAPDAADEQQAIYAQGYSLARLRDRAQKRRHYDRHHDLWQGLKILFRGLARSEPALGLPALGGLFVAAARRVAAQIAALEVGTDTADEAARQHALREVVQHCIYDVERNPLAVELCRTALWIETVERGKALTFLDPHIQCGDSLSAS